MKRSTGYLLILVCIICQALSVVLGKFASLSIREFTPMGYLTNMAYLGTLFFLGLHALCWPLTLRYFPLMWAYFFMSTIYIAIPLASHFIFHERVTGLNLLGSGVIIVGVLLLAGAGGRRAT